MPSIKDIPSISITSNLKRRNKQEEKALESDGHFYEYMFQQTIATFWWEVFEIVEEGHRLCLGGVQPNPYNPLLILAPRDHAKTSNLIESVPLRRIGKDKLELIQIISSTTPLARKRMKKIESCIRYNRRYKNLFGELYPEGDADYTWNQDEMEVIRDQEKAWDEGRAERDPSFIAFGMTSSVEGGRATLQCYDDIVTRDNSKTPAGRERTREKFWMSFDPMLLPKGQQLFAGTRYDFEDFYAELIPIFDTQRLYTDLYTYEVVEAEAFMSAAKK